MAGYAISNRPPFLMMSARLYVLALGVLCECLGICLLLLAPAWTVLAAIALGCGAGPCILVASAILMERRRLGGTIQIGDEGITITSGTQSGVRVLPGKTIRECALYFGTGEIVIHTMAGAAIRVPAQVGDLCSILDQLRQHEITANVGDVPSSKPFASWIVIYCAAAACGILILVTGNLGRLAPPFLVGFLLVLFLNGIRLGPLMRHLRRRGGSN